MSHRHAGLIALALVLQTLAACGDADQRRIGDFGPPDSQVLAEVTFPDATVTLDTAEPDASNPETQASCDEAPGGFLCPCRENDDCNSGFCVPASTGGEVCTKYCLTDCPEGWSCSLVQIPGGDPAFLCLETALNLCRPCTSDDVCREGAFGASGDRCVAWGGREGSFCGTACEADADCPTDYACELVRALTDGADVKQCVPKDDTCACSQRAIDAAATTTCEDRGCTGARRCTSDGLTECDAPAYADEVCDGADNDCDLTIDEGFPDLDTDLIADCVDPDDDNDAITDATDNCPLVANPDQRDTDRDGQGDACDSDDDNDAITDASDNCPLVANADQRDTDGDGQGDACDEVAPAPPELLSTDPASPSNDDTPTVSGRTERGAILTFYGDPDCLGPVLGTGLSDDGTFDLPVTVPQNTVTTLHATATDGAGHVSDCSTDPLVYLHDGLAPDAPVLLGTTPPSPSRTRLDPEVSGLAEAGALIRLYAFSCDSVPLGVATSPLGAFTVAARALPNTLTPFVAQAVDAAGNVSPCSDPLPYVHDDLRPPPPTLTDSDPHSPSNASTTPTLSGVSETGTTVTLYANATCLGTAIAQASATTGAFAAAVPATPEATTQFTARATDPAGNLSDCSAPFAYTHNTRIPDAPVLVSTAPPSPSRTSTTPTLTGTAAPGTVRLYLSADCAGLPVATATPSVGLFSAALTVPANATTLITATLTDAAGNVSACAEPFTYIHDDRAPAAPQLTATDPTSPSATILAPMVHGTAEALGAVTLYTAEACQGPVAARVDADALGAFAAAATVAANRTTSLSAKVTDAAGNTSPCSAPLAYTHDALAPAPPILTHTTPASPSSTITQPTIHGLAEALSTVTLYTAPACTAAVATGPADGTFAIAAAVAANTTVTFYARATDLAGNTSACSLPLSYTHDSKAPATPTIDRATPASPSSTTLSPVLSGTTDPATTVTLHGDASCLGPALATVTAVGASFLATVTLAPNTTATFYARATDLAGNTSPCSAGFPFTHDNISPAAPTLTGTTPSSPTSQTTTPFVDGAAEARATVRIYVTSCVGNPVATLTDNPGTFSVQAPATANATTTFRATATDAAGNTSPCSNALAFTHDATAPAAPVLTAFTPASPSRTTTNPTLSGTTEAGATLTFYASATCSGLPLATLTSPTAAFQTALALASNATTSVTATATDAAGNTSSCSNALAYTHDDKAPAPPSLSATLPASPSKTSTNPTLSGTAEALATVHIYDTPTCSSVALATTTATAGAAFSVAAAAVANGTRTFFATATDAAGNTSACSAGLAYTHDDKAPAAPLWTGSDPASPSRTSTTPRVSGTSEAGARVLIYLSATCAGAPVLTLDAASPTATAFSGLVTVPANQTSSLTATATDAAGNTSACSLVLTYAHDSVAPAAPSLTSTTPASPSNSVLNPVVNGTAEQNSTVRLFANATCTAPAVGTQVAATGTFGIGATVTANSATPFTAQAVDAAGNTSACSASLTYLHDNLGGDTPRITASLPASPSKTSTTPTLSGTAEANSTVRLYLTSGCTGAVAGSGPATAGNFSIGVTVAANSTTTFYAQATDTANNVSACSAGFTYIHDNQKPAAPSLTNTVPGSPNRSTAPTVNGTAETNSAVRLYTDATCTTQNGATTTATAGAFALAATVPANATTRFYATATDAAGNVSDCALPLTYISDNTAPAAPTWTGTTPSSPSNTNTSPTLAGTAEASSTVKVYASTNCTGNALATLGPLVGTSFSTSTQVTANTATSFTATATDASGNTSACSGVLTYTHDAVAPPVPVLTTTNPVSPSKSSINPEVRGTITEAGHTLELFANGTCTSPTAATVAAAATSFGATVTVTANATTTLSARSKDAAGNASACSNTLSYRHDNLAPAAPSITSSTPSSPSRTSTTPTLSGTAEANASLTIHTSADCSTAAIGTATASSTGTFTSTAVNATANATTTFYARATDAALNASVCSAGFAYVHDSLAPAAPVLTGTTPLSPSSSTLAPKVNGTVATSGLTLRLFKTADCTGASADTANVATSFAITTSVTANATTAFSAQALDAAGNTSACSNSVSFTHDTTAPNKPVLTGFDPTSPSRTSTSPKVLGTTNEVGATIQLFLEASCLGAPIATGTTTAIVGGATFAVVASATANATTTYYAKAVDAAGNSSSCSNGLGYTHDDTAPPAPILDSFNPGSPSTTTANAAVSGRETDFTSKVYLYPSKDCSGAAINTAGNLATASVFTIAFTPANLGCTPLSARAVDPAGNTSACSNTLTFAHYGCAQCVCPANDWTRQYGTSQSDLGYGVSVDLNGNSFQAGATRGALATAALGDYDATLTKRSSTGLPLWTRQFGTSAWDTANATTVDPSGNVYVTGGTNGNIDASATAVPDCAPIAGKAPCSDLWVAKYDTAGTRLWIKRYSTSRREYGIDIEWDAKNNRVLILATSANLADAAGISPQVFAADPATGALTQVWAFIDDGENKNPGGLAVDGNGNIYVQGRSQFAIAGALSTTGTGGNGALYVYKLTSAGVQTWLQHWGSPAHDIGADLTVAADGSVFAVGFLQGAPEGPGATGGPYRGANGVDWAGAGDAAIARFDANGAQQWARIFGTPLDDSATSVQIYNGQLQVAGTSRGNVITGTNVSLHGGMDFFTATFGLDGTVPASNIRQYGSTFDDFLGRGALYNGVWILSGRTMGDWTGRSIDACTFQGMDDLLLARFCISGAPVR
jgi:hypothetical protein